MIHINPLDKLSPEGLVAWKKLVELWRQYYPREVAIDLLAEAPDGIYPGDYPTHPERLAMKELEALGLIKIEEVMLDEEMSLIYGWSFAAIPTKLGIEMTETELGIKLTDRDSE